MRWRVRRRLARGRDWRLDHQNKTPPEDECAGSCGEPLAGDLSQTVRSKTTAVGEILPDFPGNETNRAAKFDKGQALLAEFKDALGADVKKLTHLLGCPQVFGFGG